MSFQNLAQSKKVKSVWSLDENNTPGRALISNKTQNQN